MSFKKALDLTGDDLKNFSGKVSPQKLDNSVDTESVDISSHNSKNDGNKKLVTSFLDTREKNKGFFNLSSLGKQLYDTARDLLGKTRYEEQELLGSLYNRFVYSRQVSFQDYEIEFLELGKKIHQELGGRNISFERLYKLRCVRKLSKNIPEIDSEEKVQLDGYSLSLIEHDPYAVAEYNLFKKLLRFLSSLIIKYQITTVHNYFYRITGKTLNCRVLPMDSVNKDMLSASTFWFTEAVKYRPLNRIESLTLRQHAFLLQSQTQRVINMIYDTTMNCDYEELPERVGKMKYKNQVLPDFKEKGFVNLSVYLGHCAKCFRGSKTWSERFRNELKDLESIYRKFETELVEQMLKITGKTAMKSYTEIK